MEWSKGVRESPIRRSLIAVSSPGHNSGINKLDTGRVIIGYHVYVSTEHYYRVIFLEGFSAAGKIHTISLYILDYVFSKPYIQTRK